MDVGEVHIRPSTAYCVLRIAYSEARRRNTQYVIHLNAKWYKDSALCLTFRDLLVMPHRRLAVGGRGVHLNARTEVGRR
jgi:hypothetical protein